MIHFFRKRAARDQADRLRSLVEEAAAPASEPSPAPYAGPPLIVLAGSKGGVGVTTLTWNLAEQLAARGVRTLAVDASMRQADLAHVAGVETSGENLADVISGKATAGDATRYVADGLWLLPGAWAPTVAPEATAGGATKLLAELDSLADSPLRPHAIVVDAGSQPTPATAPLWNAAATVLLVATPDPLSLLGAYAAIKLARQSIGDQPPQPLGLALLANRVASDRQAASLHSQVGGTCQKFLGDGVPSAGYVGEGALGPGCKWVAERLSERLQLGKAGSNVSSATAPH